MNMSSSGPGSHRRGVPDLLGTIWPRTLPTDSELQRRKKLAVRSGHLALVAMVVAAVGGAVGVNFRELTGLHLAALVLSATAYLAWSFYGTHHAIGVLLWDKGTPPPMSARVPSCGAIPYFGIQLGLAALVYGLGERGHVPNLVWLALLPPVAYSVFLLDRWGITAVSTLTVGIIVANGLYWHGWAGVLSAVLAFSFALLFTLVFTLLMVSAEQSRNEVQRLAGELGEANLKLREYAVEVEELAMARERNRLAREIHDTLGHYLTVVNVQLQAAQVLQPRDPERSAIALKKAQALTQEGLQEIRHSVAALRSSPLDNRPLTDALRELAEGSCAAGLPAALRVSGQARLLTPPAALTLYRAGQEGLTNVRKHAQARHADLILEFHPGSKVTLVISDDGIGSSDDALRASGFGLLGLRERTQLLGGCVRVRTAPNAGFVLEVEVPG